MPSKQALGLRYQRWKRRALKAEKQLDRTIEEANNRIAELQDRVNRLEQRAASGDISRQDLAERRVTEQGIYG